MSKANFAQLIYAFPSLSANKLRKKIPCVLLIRGQMIVYRQIQLPHRSTFCLDDVLVRHHPNTTPPFVWKNSLEVGDTDVGRPALCLFMNPSVLVLQLVSKILHTPLTSFRQGLRKLDSHNMFSIHIRFAF